MGKFLPIGGQDKLRMTIHGPYRKEKTNWLKNAKKVNDHQELVNCERPLMGYIGRKNDTASKLCHDRPLVNYNRP